MLSVAPTRRPPSSRVAASATPPRPPPADALPSSCAPLLDANIIDRQAHDLAPYPTVEQRPDDADATEESARRASAATLTAAQLPTSNAASDSWQDATSRRVRPGGRARSGAARRRLPAESGLGLLADP